MQEAHEATEQLRREHPEWFPDDTPDYNDTEAVTRWVEEREQRRRREVAERLARLRAPTDPAGGEGRVTNVWRRL